MKIETYVTSCAKTLGLDETAKAQVMATLRFSNVVASNPLSEATRGIVDKLCRRLAADVTKPADPVVRTPDLNASGKYDTALAQGYDPSTGNKVVPVVINKLKGRMGYYDPTTRTTYPAPVSNQASEA